jgi:hypothetical protein
MKPSPNPERLSCSDGSDMIGCCGLPAGHGGKCIDNPNFAQRMQALANDTNMALRSGPVLDRALKEIQTHVEQEARTGSVTLRVLLIGPVLGGYREAPQVLQHALVQCLGLKVGILPERVRNFPVLDLSWHLNDKETP